MSYGPNLANQNRQAAIYVDKVLRGAKPAELPVEMNAFKSQQHRWAKGSIQTCRKLIDDGWIGTPVATTAFMTCHGHESWHPDPEFYYKPGGGPMKMRPAWLTPVQDGTMLRPSLRSTWTAAPAA